MDFTVILDKYGLQMTDMLFLTGMVTFTTALLKKHAGMVGNLAFVGAVVSTAAWVAVFYLPIPKELVAGLVVLIGSTGGWQTIKDALGKVGEDNLKPMGSMDRGPSLNKKAQPTVTP